MYCLYVLILGKKCENSVLKWIIQIQIISLYNSAQMYFTYVCKSNSSIYLFVQNNTITTKSDHHI